MSLAIFIPSAIFWLEDLVQIMPLNFWLLKFRQSLFPFFWSAGKEQLMHAQLFQKKGTAEILEQSQAAEKLLEIIAKVLSNLKYYKNNFKNLELLDRKNAAEIILQTILSQHSS